MDILLRSFAEWKGRRKAAQIIVFDGGAEVETTRAFVKGALTGIVLAVAVFALAAPSAISPTMLDEFAHREMLLREANKRADQALAVADVCLNTAQSMEQTLKSYQQFLGNR